VLHLPNMTRCKLCDLLPPENTAISPHSSPASHNFHRHIILGRGSVAQSNRLADHTGHGFRFGFTDLFGGKRAAFAAMQHLVRLCCRQHKLTYVAQRFMWRSYRDARKGIPFGVNKRQGICG